MQAAWWLRRSRRLRTELPSARAEYRPASICSFGAEMMASRRRGGSPARAELGQIPKEIRDAIALEGRIPATRTTAAPACWPARLKNCTPVRRQLRPQACQLTKTRLTSSGACRVSSAVFSVAAAALLTPLALRERLRSRSAASRIPIGIELKSREATCRNSFV